MGVLTPKVQLEVETSRVAGNSLELVFVVEPTPLGGRLPGFLLENWVSVYVIEPSGARSLITAVNTAGMLRGLGQTAQKLSATIYNFKPEYTVAVIQQLKVRISGATLKENVIFSKPVSEIVAVLRGAPVPIGPPGAPQEYKPPEPTVPTLHVTVIRDYDMAPLSGCTVSISPQGERTVLQSLRTDAHGTAVFKINPGKYTVSATLYGYQSVSKDIEVVAGVNKLELMMSTAGVKPGIPTKPEIT